MGTNLGANTFQHSGYEHRKGEKEDGVGVSKLSGSSARGHAI